MVHNSFIQSHHSPTGSDDLAVATDRWSHEDQENSSPRAHCKCNGPGTFCVSVSVSVLILAMIQDQALVSSKHFLVETEDKNLVDNAVDPSIGDAHAVCMTVDEMV